MIYMAIKKLSSGKFSKFAGLFFAQYTLPTYLILICFTLSSQFNKRHGVSSAQNARRGAGPIFTPIYQ